MQTDTRAQELHDRATRGVALSAEEQAYLEKWYAQMDQEESALLGKPSPSDSIDRLQSQVNAVLARIPPVLQQIQALSAANEALRADIHQLHRKLAQTPTGKS